MRASSDDTDGNSRTSGGARRSAPSIPTCLASWVLQGGLDPSKTHFDKPLLGGFKELGAEVWCLSLKGQNQLGLHTRRFFV
jgi:hypothetical protein